MSDEGGRRATVHGFRSSFLDWGGNDRSRECPGARPVIVWPVVDPVAAGSPPVPLEGAPDEFAVPKAFVPGAVGDFAEFPAPLGSLTESLRPPAFPGPFGTPLVAAVPAPADPAFGEPAAVPVPADGPLAAPPAAPPADAPLPAEPPPEPCPRFARARSGVRATLQQSRVLLAANWTSCNAALR
jgi:hypothetical protein